MNQNEKTPNALVGYEKNYHDQKHNYEDGLKLEPRIFKRTEKDLEGNSYSVFKS